MKSGQMRSFFRSVFSCSRTEYGVFSPNTGKYGPEKTPYLDTFHAVWAIWRKCKMVPGIVNVESFKVLLRGYYFLGKPVIADFKSKVIGASGKPLTVDCKGRGDQIMTRQWLKNGIQVQPTDRIKIFKNGSLNFKTFRRGDVGKYSCSIKNRYGNDRKEVNVRLLGEKVFISIFHLS